jgi:hypothetical protein
MTTYSPRIVEAELDELMSGLAAVALEGPKGVGKTATAERRAKTIYRLDDEAQRQLVSASPRVALQASPPVLIDEWQRLPQVWDAVRRSVDEGASPGRYLLTGSAVPADDEVGPRPHTGAGRIVSVRMRPMSLAERGLGAATVSLAKLLSGDRPDVAGTSEVDLAQYAAEIVASTSPAFEAPWACATLDDYLERVVNRDFSEAGHRSARRPPALGDRVRRASATTATLAKIRDGDERRWTDGNLPTILTYREVQGSSTCSTRCPAGFRPAIISRGSVRHHDAISLTLRSRHLLGVDEGATRQTPSLFGGVRGGIRTHRWSARVARDAVGARTQSAESTCATCACRTVARGGSHRRTSRPSFSGSRSSSMHRSTIATYGICSGPGAAWGRSGRRRHRQQESRRIVARMESRWCPRPSSERE